MGCCVSGEKDGGEAEPLARPKYSWEREDRIDRSFLTVSNQDGGVVSRLPGQLKGSQFIIQDCKQSTILILDYTETATVDRCTDCQIFIAPSRGSVFIRDCTNCTCVIACQQFRARDCTKCTISLLSTTNPVIEASTKMRFSCYQCSYPQLKGLFDSAKLSVFNNSWSTIHDFDRSSVGNNWSLMHEENPVIIELPTEGDLADVGISFSRETSVVPLTVGAKQRAAEDSETCLVAFFNVGDSDDPGIRFVSSVQGKVVLVSTKRTKMQSHEAQTVFPNDPELVSKATIGTTIFIEMTGEDCCLQSRQALNGLQQMADTGNMYVSPSPDKGTTDVEAFNNYIEANVGM